MEKKNPQERQLKIELSKEMAEGVYANLAIITHSSSEFVFDFIRLLPGAPNANVKSRVVMGPEHAKRLLGALQENIMKYEMTFGPIKLSGSSPHNTANPFCVPKGKA